MDLSCFVMVGLSCALLLFVINRLVWRDLPPLHVPGFESFTNADDPGTVHSIIKEARARMTSGADKRTWTTYHLSAKGSEYLMDGGYSTRTTIENGRRLTEILRDGKEIGTRAMEVSPNSASVEGVHNGQALRVRIHHGRERVEADLEDHRVVITGVGATSGKHPDFFASPVVLMEGNRPITIITEKEIELPKNQIPNAPLALLIYSMLQTNARRKQL